jgi:hypothetical protein
LEFLQGLRFQRLAIQAFYSSQTAYLVQDFQKLNANAAWLLLPKIVDENRQSKQIDAILPIFRFSNLPI